jgi:hypothetical protein
MAFVNVSTDGGRTFTAVSLDRIGTTTLQDAPSVRLAVNGGYNVAGLGDFFDNGTSDVRWFNSSTRDVGFWSISGGAITGWHDLGTAPGGYSVAAAGDYLGNGTSDFLLQNSATGDTGYWSISSGAVSGTHDLGTANAGYLALNPTK